MGQSVQMLDHYQAGYSPTNQLGSVFSVLYLETRIRARSIELANIRRVNKSRERTTWRCHACACPGYRTDLYCLAQGSQHNRSHFRFRRVVIEFDC